MNKFFLILIFIFIAVFGYSQTRTILVLIDTVYLGDIKEDFDVFFSNEKFYGYNVIDSSFNKKNEMYTDNTMRFCGQIKLNTDSSIIRIPIDNNNGYIEIFNLTTLKDGDTLNIDNIKLFESDMCDTIFTIIEYYKFKNDSISNNPYKIKTIKKIKKKSNTITPPKFVFIYINNRCYNVQILKEKHIDNVYSHFNGQKPLNTRKPRIKFFGWTGTTDWRYVGYLRL